jgi:predicted MPP superfamily phosphohydrolase
MKLLRGLLAGLLLVEIAYFLFDQTTGIVVETPRIADAELASIFGGVRVVQISDLHVTHFGYLERKLIKTLDRIDPDVIFIAGDFVTGPGGINVCIDVLREIVRRRVVIAVLGNNDHSSRQDFINTSELVKGLKKAGVHVLLNESLFLSVRRPGAAARPSVYVVGVDDNFLWRDDLFKATTNVPADAPKILLAHAPNIVEKIDPAHIHLILSGHTHGGQIALPFIGALYTNPTFHSKLKLVAGLYDEGTKLYVNRGIGTVMVPLRIFARPEVTVFRFVDEKGNEKELR